MNAEETAEVLGYLTAAFRVEFNEGNVVVWAQQLSDLDHHDALTAAVRLAKACKFMPSIAEVRAAADVEKDRRTRPYVEALPAAPMTEDERDNVRRLQTMCLETLRSQRRSFLGDDEYERRLAAAAEKLRRRKAGKA